MIPRVVRLAVGTGLVVGVSCLFSTTAPKRTPTPGEPSDPTEVVLTGLVQFFDRSDGRTRSVPEWPVSVVWLGPDRTGDGQPDVVNRAVINSGPSGVYEARYRDRTLTTAEVKAAVCTYNPDQYACCLATPPECPTSQCQIWTTPRRLTVHPGQRSQQNVVVPCDHLP